MGAKRTKSQHLLGPGEEEAAPQASVSWAAKALEASKVKQPQVFRRLVSERDTHFLTLSLRIGCFNLILGKCEIY